MSEAITEDSAYNLSIMMLQGEGHLNKKDRQHLMNSIKFYEAALAALRTKNAELEKELAKLKGEPAEIKYDETAEPIEKIAERITQSIPPEERVKLPKNLSELHDIGKVLVRVQELETRVKELEDRYLNPKQIPCRYCGKLADKFNVEVMFWVGDDYSKRTELEWYHCNCGKIFSQCDEIFTVKSKQTPPPAEPEEDV